MTSQSNPHKGTETNQNFISELHRKLENQRKYQKHMAFEEKIGYNIGQRKGSF